MGIFKNFKEDLSQAVNELLPEELLDNKEAINDGIVEEVQASSATDIITNSNDAMDKDFVDDYSRHNETKALYKNEKLEDKKEDNLGSKQNDMGSNGSNEITIIAKGTVVNGNISSEGSLEVVGAINGDVDCLGKLSVFGKINGNCSAEEVNIASERLLGSIISRTSIKIGREAVVIGDIMANAGYIAGAIKGDIDIDGSIVIDSTAVIKGNIKAKSIQVNEGAIIEGFCSLSYASVDMDSIFA
jgi:cytoskeletal protein CcmA (bactofilin family)